MYDPYSYNSAPETPWIKIIFLFVLLVILPVWVFNFMDISIKWKLIFTAGGAIGIYLKFGMGFDMKLHK